jgi:cytochrome b561
VKKLAEGAFIVRYGPIAQGFHWITALLVLAAFLISAGGPERIVYSPERSGQLLTHETLGFLVFVLTLARLAWRSVHDVPELLTSPWMRRLSRLVQWLLYGLLVLVPVSAIAGAWLSAHPVMIAGFGPIGPFTAETSKTGRQLAEVHGLLGDALMWVAGLHAGAALFHHFWLKDRTLGAMLPGAR